MKSHKIWIFNIIIILFIAQIEATLSNKAQNILISPKNTRVSYQLDAKQGEQFSIRVQAKKQNFYYVALYRPNQYYPEYAPIEYILKNGTTEAIFNLTDSEGIWVIQIFPKYINDTFIASVQIYVGIKHYGPFLELIKTKHTVILKYNKGQNCTFSVKGIPDGLVKQIKIDLYQGGAALDFVKTNKIYSNQNQTKNSYTVLCQAKQFGYHYLTIQGSILSMLLMPQITIQYQTNDYICQYDKSIYNVDYILKQCTPSPCLEFSSIDNCKTCGQKYVLQDGMCYLNFTCKDNQYFDKQQCKEAVKNCINYDYVGGKCRKCAQNYQILSNSSITLCQITKIEIDANKPSSLIRIQTKPPNPNPTPAPSSNPQIQKQQQIKTPENSTPPTIAIKTPSPHLTTQPLKNIVILNCPQGKYLFKGQCIDNPPNCAQVQVSRRICINCNNMYIFNPQYNRCQLPQITCQPFFTNIGNRCLAYPVNCKKTNSLGRCTLCNEKYRLVDRQCI